MFGNGRLAVRTTLAAGLAGLALAAAAPAVAQAGPASRPAPAQAAPAGAGSFKTWAAAQTAAGFTLYSAKNTAGLTRKQSILVTPCTAASKVSYDVYAVWGGATFLALDQNNTGAACSNPGTSTYITSYKVSGVSYRLRGFCGTKGQPSCSSKKATLMMTWQIGTRYYVAYSHGEPRATLLSFATSIKKA